MRVYVFLTILYQLWATVAREHGTNFLTEGINPDNVGYINQHGLSRKVTTDTLKADGRLCSLHSPPTVYFPGYQAQLGTLAT
jgi:hypothetical protein